MDADRTPSARPTLPAGGTVEPANPATVTRARARTPIEMPGERYELRDPFAEVTYRTNTFADMVAKADQLGSRRFTALDAQGKRTTVHKIDGEWQRGPQRSAAPERPFDTTPVQDDVPQMTAAASKRPSPPRSQAEAVDAKANVKAATTGIDAKAERATLVAELEAALMDRYIIKRAPVTVGDVTIGRTEYRFRGDILRVAFTESTFRLATDTNSPSVARSMVDVAQARNWRALRVSGNEDFKRLVWLEASVRGVKAIGYEPNVVDLEMLKKAREARQVNRIEPERPSQDNRPAAAAPAAKASTRSGGRKAVLAAIEAVLVAKHVPEKQRDAVMAAATEKLAQRVREGQSIKVKVYDKAAPSRRPVMPTPDLQRGRERAAPTR